MLRFQKYTSAQEKIGRIFFRCNINVLLTRARNLRLIRSPSSYHISAKCQSAKTFAFLSIYSRFLAPRSSLRTHVPKIDADEVNYYLLRRRISSQFYALSSFLQTGLFKFLTPIPPSPACQITHAHHFRNAPWTQCTKNTRIILLSAYNCGFHASKIDTIIDSRLKWKPINLQGNVSTHCGILTGASRVSVLGEPLNQCQRNLTKLLFARMMTSFVRFQKSSSYSNGNRRRKPALMS